MRKPGRKETRKVFMRKARKQEKTTIFHDFSCFNLDYLIDHRGDWCKNAIQLQIYAKFDFCRIWRN